MGRVIRIRTKENVRSKTLLIKTLYTFLNLAFVYVKPEEAAFIGCHTNIA